MNNKPLVIVSACPHRTGSTLLYNAICGLINPEQPIIYTKAPVDSGYSDLSVIKTHSLNTARWLAVLRKYDVYFICAERLSKKRRFPEKYKTDNMLIVEYTDLLETPEYTIRDIAGYLGTNIRALLPKRVNVNVDTCEERITKMNEMVRRLDGKPFKVWDKFYGIHGNHRHRNTQKAKAK